MLQPLQALSQAEDRDWEAMGTLLADDVRELERPDLDGNSMSDGD